MNRPVRIIKRAFDVMGATVGLVVASPLMLIAALLIKLHDGGPIIYGQERAGGQLDPDADATASPTFTMYKFRTMRPGADSEAGSNGRPARTAKNDPRVTPIGRYLRRTRLDELPQLINVLRGDMSIVGPRPERPEVIADLTAAIPFYEERMRMVKPGITGLAQVNLDYSGFMDDGHRLAHLKSTLVNPFSLEYEGTTEADDQRTKILFDFAYAASLERLRSFVLTDAGILLKTPLVMLRGRGR